MATLRSVLLVAIGVVCITVVALGVLIGALWIYYPDSAVVRILRYPHEPPPLFQGQITKADFPGNPGANIRLTRALVRQFPMQSDAEALKSTLRTQGFRFDPIANPQNGSARYSWGAVVCSETVLVEWTTDAQDRLTGLNAAYAASCT